MNVTAQNYEEIITGTDKLVILDFKAVWCGPCSMLAPILEAAQKEYPDVLICTCDADESPELAAAFEIKFLPTLLFIKNGRRLDKTVGLVEADELKALIEKYK